MWIQAYAKYIKSFVTKICPFSNTVLRNIKWGLPGTTMLERVSIQVLKLYQFITILRIDTQHVTKVTILYLKHENNKFREAQFHIQHTLTQVLPGLCIWKVMQIIIRDLQTFINKCVRKTFKIFWPNIISNAELWRHAQQEKPQRERETMYPTEIYTDGSKVGGKVGAGVAIYSDKRLVRQCKYRLQTAVLTIKPNRQQSWSHWNNYRF